MKELLKKQTGQALIIMLFISVIGLTVISSAAIFIFQNIQAASTAEQGAGAYYIAESGAQESLLRLIRDVTYSGTPVGQPLVIDSGNVVIQISSASGIITSTSIGTYSNSVRKIQVKTVYNNGVLTVTSWKEVL